MERQWLNEDRYKGECEYQYQDALGTRKCIKYNTTCSERCTERKQNYDQASK